MLTECHVLEDENAQQPRGRHVYDFGYVRFVPPTFSQLRSDLVNVLVDPFWHFGMSKYRSGDEEEEDDELRDFSGEPELDPDLTDKRFEQGESSSGQRRSGEDRVDRCVPGGGAECDLPEDRMPVMRLDREKTEKMPRERHLVMETNLKEMVKRGEVQKLLEIEVDRLFRVEKCLGTSDIKK
ncbi:hypothetical protein ACSBR2_033351 [Camellia fascicularis]